MKNGKIKLLVIILALASIITAFSVAVFASGDEPRVKLQIKAANLSFDDSVYTLYAVAIEGAEADGMKLLFWNEPKASTDEYKIGTEDHSAEIHGTAKVSGTTCYTFKNTKLRARNMADDVYARAYIEVDGVGYYSDIVKYSILQYAYNKLGLTGTAGGESLQKMLKSMLEYGAAAQEYFGYRTDRLANGEFYQVRTTGGTLSDGTARGLYLKGSEVTISAPNELEGKTFLGWQNSAGTIVSADNPATVTVGEANETYTAVYDIYSPGLKYTLSEDGTYYVVSGIGTCTDADITVPLKYMGKEVKAIGENAFYGNSKITSITLTDNITKIGTSAFYFCTSLKSASFGTKIEKIGDMAFYYCISLESIDIPDSVTYLGEGAFACCEGVKTASIGKGITAIGNSAFSYCRFDTLSIPEGVKSIGEYAFHYCDALKNIVIPASVESIGYEAFYPCDGIESIYYAATDAQWAQIAIGTHNDSITDADIYYYSENEPITEGKFWHYVEGIPTAWPEFVKPAYSVGLEYTLSEDETYYTLSGVGDCTDADIIIPEKYKELPVSAIGDKAFSGKTEITSIKIPDSIASIGTRAFYGCTGLTEITIPRSVTSIGTQIFYKAENLSTVYYNTDYYEEDNPILNLKHITKVVFGGTRVPAYVFNNKLFVTDVIIEDSVTSIGYMAFSDCSSLTSVVIPDSVTTIGNRAFYNCTSLTTITVGESNTAYKSIDGNLYTKDGKTLIQYAIGKADTSFEIPDSVTKIGNSAFLDCSSLVGVVIGDGVTEIGSYAFAGCDSLTSVVIGNSVTEIGEEAFWDCFGLEIILYKGTAEDWSAIAINSYNDDLTSATLYYYSETAPTEEGNYWYYDENGEVAIWE